jgi:hypothetical protein
MNSGVVSLKRSLFSPLWEQVQGKRCHLPMICPHPESIVHSKSDPAAGSCRLLLDQLKFCWNSTPHACNAKTVYGERQGHRDTRIIMPRSICQYRKQRMHACMAQDRAQAGCFSTLTVGALTTVTSYLRTENARRNTDASISVVYKRSSVACAGSCLIIIFHPCVQKWRR